jgi:hypothetical protein
MSFLRHVKLGTNHHFNNVIQINRQAVTIENFAKICIRSDCRTMPPYILSTKDRNLVGGCESLGIDNSVHYASIECRDSHSRFEMVSHSYDLFGAQFLEPTHCTRYALISRKRQCATNFLGLGHVKYVFHENIAHAVGVQWEPF